MSTRGELVSARGVHVSVSVWVYMSAAGELFTSIDNVRSRVSPPRVVGAVSRGRRRSL